MFVKVLMHNDDIVGLCLNEVGNLDDPLDENDKELFESLIQETFEAAQKPGPVQFVGEGETVTAWAHSVSVTILLPLEKMKELPDYRRVERFELHGATGARRVFAAGVQSASAIVRQTTLQKNSEEALRTIYNGRCYPHLCGQARLHRLRLRRRRELRRQHMARASFDTQDVEINIRGAAVHFCEHIDAAKP